MRCDTEIQKRIYYRKQNSKYTNTYISYSFSYTNAMANIYARTHTSRTIWTLNRWHGRQHTVLANAQISIICCLFLREFKNHFFFIFLLSIRRWALGNYSTLFLHKIKTEQRETWTIVFAAVSSRISFLGSMFIWRRTLECFTPFVSRRLFEIQKK